MEKCIWCNKSDKALEKIDFYGNEKPDFVTNSYCYLHSEHKDAFLKYCAFRNEKLHLLSKSLFFLVVLSFLSLWFGFIWGLLIVICLGLLLYNFPFATSLLIRDHGIKKSIKMSRIFSIFMFLLSLLLIFLQHISK